MSINDIYSKINKGTYTNLIKYAMAKTDVAQHTLWANEEARLYELFKSDLFANHGLTNHPKADLAFSYAWEDGHSHGYNEIACSFENYASLLK